jgi:hypothetical protein
VFAVLAVSLPLLAQTTNARIVGSLRDASGGAIVGATVQVKNDATNAVREAVTNESGDYFVPNLPIGAYSVSAEMRGFKRVIQPGIQLTIDQTARVDLVLQPGDLAESITVEAARPLVESEQSSVGKVVENRTLLQLPLTARNFISLGSLVPGTTSGAPGNSVVRDRQEGSALTANGQRAENNNFLLDGSDNTANFVGVVVVVPSMDAIQEFKVQTSNYSAEFGRAAGAIVNIAIKSGGNQFHGTGYEFLRNDKLDAREFFSPARTPLRRNNFGGSLGGPVIRNKTFFFLNYEGLLERRVGTSGNLVPTEAMRRGDFSALPTLYDPLSLNAAGDRLPFSANQIPSARINPISAKLLSVWPLPNNSDPVRNYLENLNNPLDRHQFHVRGDHNLTSRDTLMARISWTHTDDVNRAIALNGQTVQNKHRSGVVGWTRTFTPAIVNDLRLTGTDYNYNLIPDGQGTDYAAQYGLPSFATGPTITRHPSISVSNIAGAGGADTIPLLRREVFYQIIESLTWVHRKQTLKFGGDVRLYRSNNYQPQSAMGQYSFTGAFTAQKGRTYNNGFGDLLLGYPLSQRILIPVSYDATRINNDRVNLYAQDDVQLSSRLTLNLGLRWERDGNWYETQDRWAYLDYRTGEVVYPKTVKIPFKLPYAHRFDDIRSMKQPTNKAFAPRLGFAWRPFGGNRTVIRAAYGLFWGVPQGFVLLNSASTPPPFYLRSEFTSSATTPELRFGVFPGVSADNFVPATPTFFTHNPYTFTNAYVQQWNFGIDRQLTRDTAVTAAYVGNKATHLERRQQGNPALPPGAGNLNARRLFPKVGSITHQESSSYSTYHSLQMSAERKLSHGLLFLAGFTWAKSLDDTSTWSGLGGQESQFAQDPSRLFLEKARSGFDIRRRFTLSYVYEMPFHFRMQAVDAVLGGWQTAGIITLQSGFPVSATVSGDIPNAGTGNTRPNLVGAANLDPSQRTIDRWFNTSAFTSPAPFTFGTAGRNIIDAPGSRAFTASLMKAFRITERNRLQFRAEFNNFFNHANFGLPNASFGAAAFGTIRSTNGARQTQVGLKYIF